MLLPLGQGSFLLQRLILAFLLGIWLQQFSAPMTDAYGYRILAECAIGILLVLPMLALLGAASFIGELFDFGRGQQLSGVFDALSQSQETTSAVLLRTLLWTSCLALGFGEHLLRILTESYRTFPGGVLFFEINAARVGDLLSLVAAVMKAALSLFLPFVAVFLLVDFALAYVSRLAPTLSLTLETFVVKLGLSTLLLLSSIDSHWESGLFDFLLRAANAARQ